VNKGDMDRRRLEVWNTRIALFLAFLGLVLLTLPLRGMFMQTGAAPETKLATTGLFAFAIIGSLVLLFSTASFILQIVAWKNWLRDRRIGQSQRPPIWHILVLVAFLLLLAAPIETTDVNVTLPSTTIDASP
jgi:hypothetical protein